jgi:Family of unknown function (DUF5677)
MDEEEFDRFRQVLEHQATPMARDIWRLTSQNRGERIRQQAAVRRTVLRDWMQAWEYWDAVVYGAQQNAVLLLQRRDRTRPDFALDEHASVRDALCLIQFAGTLTLQEVGTLLVNGFWAGAAARWRALHELAVTAILVARGGADIATRYHDHGYVVQTRRLAQYRAAHGVGPVGPDELLARKQRSEELIARHTLPNESTSFPDSYGWATPLMPLSKKGTYLKPTFDHLEKKAGLTDLRLLVASAHGLVHNDSAGVVTAVLGESDGATTEWIGVAIPRFTATVARPAMITMGHLQNATLLGFEPAWSEFARTLAMVAAGTATLTGWAVEAFEATPGHKGT